MAVKKSGYLSIRNFASRCHVTLLRTPAQLRALHLQPPTRTRHTTAPHTLPKPFRNYENLHRPSIHPFPLRAWESARSYANSIFGRPPIASRTRRLPTHSPASRIPRTGYILTHGPAASEIHHPAPFHCPCIVRAWCGAARAARRRRMMLLQRTLTMQLCIPHPFSYFQSVRGAACAANANLISVLPPIAHAVHANSNFFCPAIACEIPIPPHPKYIRYVISRYPWPPANDIHHPAAPFHRPCVVRRRARSASAAHGPMERAENASCVHVIHMPIHQACVARRASRTET